MAGRETEFLWNSKRIACFGLALAVLMSVVVVSTAVQARRAHSRHGRQTVIPRIANLAGVMVGWDTVDSAERHVGRGEVLTGGHPQGARVWRFGSAGWILHVDGFGLRYRPPGPSGEIIDWAHVLRNHDLLCKTIYPPSLKRGQWKSGYWGFLPLGTRYHRALKLLKQRGLKPKGTKDCLVVQAHGYATVDANVPDFTLWKAELSFEKGRLVDIVVTCD